MEFAQELKTNLDAVLPGLGYRHGKADEETLQDLAAAAAALEGAARPRWCAKRFGLAGNTLVGTGMRLAGDDINRHLEQCEGAVLLAVTLGQGAEALLRAATAADMRRAVLLDALASGLVEQYADAAEAQLRAGLAPGEYMTGRFSPGYGDFPLESQAELVRLADAPRQAGLTALGGGLLAPTKSITAVLGTARVPVRGSLAGCATCHLNGNCERQREGNTCGKADNTP